MTVGQLRALLKPYGDHVHVGIVWPNAHQAEDGPWLAEIEKLITATHQETGETDVFLEATEIEFDV